MLKKLLWIILALATAAQAAIPDAGLPALKPLPQQPQAAFLASQVLERFHYREAQLDDAMSGRIFDQYLKALDPEKIFFVQSDIDGFAELRTKLDDAIAKKDLDLPFSVFNRYRQRTAERLAYARSLLAKGFDFREKESFQYERKNEPWPQSEAEMRELWRKRVKNDWLRLRLAGKDSKEIVETLDRRYENSRKRGDKVTSEDAFQVFMNAYTTAIEPHTNYLVPRAAADFDISMRLSLVGIGAVLSERNDYTTIRELIPGGPAALSGQLQVGDRILGVAQGTDGAMTDVQGWRLDDTVAIIRGAADSVIVLDILPANAGPDGEHRRVSLVRKKVTLEEQSAKRSVVSVKDGESVRRIGVITLPSFYEDFEGRYKNKPDYKSATRDVARLLTELKNEKVDAVLVDLRNNGGGSLSEAIDLTGLFVGKGPVLQQRNAKGEISVLSNSSRDVVWKGPLGVLINRGSASASEIFAAAIQDYGRGLIIGEPSFGKGTVQSMLDLDQVAKNSSPLLGELKFTLAQFFRINGGTTQLRGVTPDVPFPSVSDSDGFGEASFDNAIPWMQIKPAEYTASSSIKLLEPILQARSQARKDGNKGFGCLIEGIAEFERQQKKGRITLNEAERRQERSAEEERMAACDTRDETGAKALVHGGAVGKLQAARRGIRRDDGLLADERNLVADLAEEKERKAAKDILLEEASNILGDVVGLLKPRENLVVQAAKEAAP